MAQMVQALRGETRLDARAVPQVVQPAPLGSRNGMVSTLAPLFAAAKLGRSFLSALTGQAFLGNGHSPSPPASGRLRLLLVLGFVLPAILTPLTSVFPATLTTLDVEAYGAPPGFLNADLPRYLAQQMAEAPLTDWRFEPIAGRDGPPNRVEWSFKWDPYAGGEVRRFAHPSMSESLFGVHRPITITARLYLGGAYLRLVSEQAIIEGGRRDPDLSAVIVRLTQDLLARGVDNSIDSLPLSVSR